TESARRAREHPLAEIVLKGETMNRKSRLDGGTRPAPGFTLIELLVVIAIIAILAAILFPVFAQAREKSRQAVCTSRMKHFGMADNMYCQDYDEYFPAYTTGPNPSWLGKIKPYVQTLIGKSTGSERGGPLNICPSYQIEHR